MLHVYSTDAATRDDDREHCCSVAYRTGIEQALGDPRAGALRERKRGVLQHDFAPAAAPGARSQWNGTGEGSNRSGGARDFDGERRVPSAQRLGVTGPERRIVRTERVDWFVPCHT